MTMRFINHVQVILLSCFAMLLLPLDPPMMMSQAAFLTASSTDTFKGRIQPYARTRPNLLVAKDKNGDNDVNQENEENEGSKSTTRTPLEASDVGEYNPSKKLGKKRDVNVGDPQIKVKDREQSVTAILKELAAIQQQGPQKYCILGTRHCSYLHQQIIELLAYALVLSGNHVYTSGAGGTHAATIRGALRAGNEELLTVVIPQSLGKQPKESQELLEKVTNLVTMPQNDDMSLDIASRICNSFLLSQTDQLISFAFHESSTVIEASKEAKKLDMLVTTLYLD